MEDMPEIATVPAQPPAPANLGGALLASLRPRQWTKNGAVLAPLIFAREALQAGPALRALAATAGFCLLSSAVYLFNDLIDRERDRLHPVKRLRPIASGALAPAVAAAAGAGLVALALGVFLWLGRAPLAAAAGYLALQVAYTALLKRMVILDVIAISIGFVIRVASGALAISVPISNWLYLCTFLLALFLGFSKRRAELVLLEQSASEHRASLADLSLPLLDQLIGAVTASTVVCYALYTMSDDTIRKFGSDGLKFTIPCVVYGIFRYLYLLYRRNEGGSPERLLLSDLPLILDIALYVGIVGVVLYA